MTATTATSSQPKRKLTRLERSVSYFIVGHYRQDGRWPTINEIKVGLRHNSPGEIMATIGRLQTSGHLSSSYKFGQSDMTYAQRTVFDFIVQFKIEHDGMTPSIREITEGVGYKSTSTAHRTIIQLNDMGIIQVDSTKSRAIRLPGGHYHYAGVTS